jgi:hypothetical protein
VFTTSNLLRLAGYVAGAGFVACGLDEAGNLTSPISDPAAPGDLLAPMEESLGAAAPTLLKMWLYIKGTLALVTSRGWDNIKLMLLPGASVPTRIYSLLAILFGTHTPKTEPAKPA